jgi:hypothetical protein
LAIHDGPATRPLIETLAVIALASLGISVRAIDVNFVGRSTQGLKIAAAIPAIWMVVQLLPTPIGAHSVWASANEALAQQTWGHISIDLGSTIVALAFCLANISLILVAIFVARDRRRADQILSALTAIATITTLGLLIGKWTLIASVINTAVLAGVSALGILLSLASGVRTIERHKTGGEKPETGAQNVRTADRERHRIDGWHCGPQRQRDAERWPDSDIRNSCFCLGAGHSSRRPGELGRTFARCHNDCRDDHVLALRFDARFRHFCGLSPLHRPMQFRSRSECCRMYPGLERAQELLPPCCRFTRILEAPLCNRHRRYQHSPLS